MKNTKTNKKATNNKVNNKVKENVMRVEWTTKNGNKSTRELINSRALLRTQNGFKEIEVYAIKGYDEVVIQKTTKGYRLVLVGAGMFVPRKDGKDYKSLASACEYGIRHALKVKRENLELFNKRAKELAEMVKASKPVKCEVIRKTPAKSVEKKSTKKLNVLAELSEEAPKKTTKKVAKKSTKANKPCEEVKAPYGEGFASILRAGYAF